MKQVSGDHKKPYTPNKLISNDQILVSLVKVLKKSYDYLSRVERDNSNIKHEIDDTKVLTDEVVRAKVQQESNKNIEDH